MYRNIKTAGKSLRFIFTQNVSVHLLFRPIQFNLMTTNTLEYLQFKLSITTDQAQVIMQNLFSLTLTATNINPWKRLTSENVDLLHTLIKLGLHFITPHWIKNYQHIEELPSNINQFIYFQSSLASLKKQYFALFGSTVSFYIMILLCPVFGDVWVRDTAAQYCLSEG